jgi:hypothetical protein
MNQVAALSVAPAPDVPMPTMPVIAQTNAAPAQTLPSTNLYYRFRDKDVKLTAEQLEAYLKENGTNAASLLAAYRTSRDPALLREAMEKYPNDPHVAFEAIFGRDLSPEERRQWMTTFEQAAPDNALGNYLSAFNYFDAGQTDKALQELNAASGKQFDDYTVDRIETDEEAYLSAGYPPAEAKTIATQSVLLEQLTQIKKLGQSLVSQANTYTQSGDAQSAQAVLQMAMGLGQNVAGASSSSPALISQLVGVAIQKMALGAMDPNAAYGNGLTVQDEINQINQSRAALQKLNAQVEPLMPTLSDQDVMNFENRRVLFGEVAAMQWVASKYGQQ